jgi:predicted CopG family antitoxin
MPTTVQVSAETRRLLERLKKDMGLESYDDVIGRLAKKQAGMPESLFGACRGSKPFRREPEIEHSL